jgi:general secretion pathway protein J
MRQRAQRLLIRGGRADGRNPDVRKRCAQPGFDPATCSAEHGFTLVEVMIALLIFSMLAVAGVAILSFSVRAGAASGARLDDVAALNRTLSVLSADLAEAVDRPTRDEAGIVRPAFAGESAGSAAPMLQLVRGGWSNLDALPRPGLQKVAYQLARGALERVAYPQLDGAAPLAPAVLMTGIRDARLRYRIAGAWNDRWDGTAGAPLPQAMELTLVRSDGITWRRLFLVGNGRPPQSVMANAT